MFKSRVEKQGIEWFPVLRTGWELQGIELIVAAPSKKTPCVPVVGTRLLLPDAPLGPSAGRIYEIKRQVIYSGMKDQIGEDSFLQDPRADKPILVIDNIYRDPSAFKNIKEAITGISTYDQLRSFLGDYIISQDYISNPEIRKLLFEGI